jgi:hypothetical protein
MEDARRGSRRTSTVDRIGRCCHDRLNSVYFRWGTKRIPYNAIRSVRRVDIDALSGRVRIWGTANPLYWAHVDPDRPKKQVGLVLDLHRFVHPFITPDDPDAVEAVIREHGWLGPADGDGRRPVV